MTASNGIVQKLWNYCNVLRDDGLSYQDYLEQLATLLFLKMAHEQSQLLGKASIIPPDSDGKALDWSSLMVLEGADLEIHYRHVLTELGKKPGMLGMIFRKAKQGAGPGKATPAHCRPDRQRAACPSWSSQVWTMNGLPLADTSLRGRRPSVA